jgi:hypothetical protein
MTGSLTDLYINDYIDDINDINDSDGWLIPKLDLCINDINDSPKISMTSMTSS